MYETLFIILINNFTIHMKIGHINTVFVKNFKYGVGVRIYFCRNKADRFFTINAHAHTISEYVYSKIIK